MVLRVIGNNLEESCILSRFWPTKHGLTPWDFGQNFKFAQTSCIGKRSREMMFGMVLRVIGNNLEESWF